MATNIKLRTVNWIFLALMVIAGISITTAAYYINKQVEDVKYDWLLLESDRTEKVRLLNVLRDAMGFGGMVHNFKNFILRQNPEKLHLTHESIDMAKGVLHQYRSLVLTTTEQQALEGIETTILDYERRADEAAFLAKQGKEIGQIDDATRINDAPALSGLSQLKIDTDSAGERYIPQHSSKARILSDIRAAIGFGGMIHHFKDYVLRGDDSCVENFIESYTQATLNISIYRNHDINPREDLALTDLANTFASYEENIYQAQRLIKEGKSPQQIDQAVKIFDEPALKALQTLDQEINHYINALSLDVHEDLGEIEEIFSQTTWGVMLILSVVSLLSIWLLQRHLIGPVKDLTENLHRLANNQTDVHLKRKYHGNELGMMAQAMSAFKQNIIQRLRVEEELITAKDAALKASKMKSEFLANMSHEIRTPLNGVLGTIDLLRDTQLNTTQYEYIEAAYRSSEHLLALINDILDISKFEAGGIELESVDFDLTEAVEDLADLYGANARSKGLELNWGMGSDVPDWVVGDRVRLWQILTNLTGNALKFTEQGSVSINVRKVHRDAGRILLKFEITDTGIGIPPEAQTRIFNAFEQADGTTTRRFGGTGLGLSLSKRLVELMGGEIGVDSVSGEGSTFWFTAQLDCTHLHPIAHPAALEGKRLLIVDDVALNRQLAERFAEKWGMKSHSVEGGYQALEAMAAAHSENQAYDMILLDHQMPDMDGVETAFKIRHHDAYRDTKIVLYSSVVEDVSRTIEEPGIIDAFLRKPMRRKTLQNNLLRLYGEEVIVDAEYKKAPTHHSNAKILLVDDNDVNRMVARGMLEKAGITHIETAVDGQQAVDRVNETQYDLVLMDIQMPVMNGFDATQTIRSNEADTRHTTIVALTANAFKEDIKKCLDAGMNDYLSKPLQKDALINILDTWLHDKVAPVDDEPSQPQDAEHPVEQASDSTDTTLPAIDSATMESMKEILGEDGLKMVIASFTENTPMLIEQLQNSHSELDWELLSRSAHTIKGSSGSFGAQKLAELSLQVERQAKGKNGDNMQDLIDQIQTEYERVAEALKQY